MLTYGAGQDRAKNKVSIVVRSLFGRLWQARKRRPLTYPSTSQAPPPQLQRLSNPGTTALTAAAAAVRGKAERKKEGEGVMCLYIMGEITHENMKKHTHENIRGEAGRDGGRPTRCQPVQHPTYGTVPLSLSPVALDFASCHSDTACPCTPGRGRAVVGIYRFVAVKSERGQPFAIGSNILTRARGFRFSFVIFFCFSVLRSCISLITKKSSTQ